MVAEVLKILEIVEQMHKNALPVRKHATASYRLQFLHRLVRGTELRSRFRISAFRSHLL